jgi:hypothetical protein
MVTATPILITATRTGIPIGGLPFPSITDLDTGGVATGITIPTTATVGRRMDMQAGTPTRVMAL